MRCMAVAAIFADRGMLKQKRPALFSVAIKTGLIDIGLYQLGIAQAAVRAMAIGADCFAFGNGVARGQMQLAAYARVALGACRHLVIALEYRVAALMANMATRTAKTCVFVARGLPVRLAGLVATQALLALLRCR